MLRTDTGTVATKSSYERSAARGQRLLVQGSPKIDLGQHTRLRAEAGDCQEQFGGRSTVSENMPQEQREA